MWKMIHGGPKFGSHPPLLRDSLSIPSQVWSIDFLCEIFDNVINSRQYASLVQSEQKRWTKAANSNSLRSHGIKSVRIRRFGPFSWFDLDQICRFDEFEYRQNLRIRQEFIMWSKFRRDSQWTKFVTVCMSCHVMKEVVDKTLDPRVSGYMMADTVIFSFTNFGQLTHVFSYFRL